MAYYDDLSVGSTGNASITSSSSSEEDGDHFPLDPSGSNASASAGLWDRSILHLDVDCFYCQCEEIDRNLRDVHPPRPLAIGQKHIIVTSNYEARSFGVKKLQSRDAAKIACPSLWIVEGSDLRQYRKHSRSIYEAFRRCLQEIAQKLDIELLPAKKGCMDEMAADLTPAVEVLLSKPWLQPNDSGCDQNMFVFGDSERTSVAVLVEDQTGVEAVVSMNSTSGSIGLTDSRRNVHESFGSMADRKNCEERLRIAAKLTLQICKQIRAETAFSTSGGISISPLLAKVCSGLNKPKSVNVLYPWRSPQLMYTMPLRMMPSVGHKTAKVLRELLDCGTSGETIRDLLALPKGSILNALGSVQQFQNASERHCDELIERCRGHDLTNIVDDSGGLPKTVSVEDSFRRGTVVTMAGVWRGLEALFVRLPKLLEDRSVWAREPDLAYPTTIRLTIRRVDQAIVHIRRPFRTQSKQTPLDGRALMSLSGMENKASFIKKNVVPLVGHLLPPTKVDEINVTRINIAVTGFPDVSSSPSQKGSASLVIPVMKPRRMAGAVGSHNRPAKRSNVYGGSTKELSVKPVTKKQKNSRIDTFFALKAGNKGKK